MGFIRILSINDTSKALSSTVMLSAEFLIVGLVDLIETLSITENKHNDTQHNSFSAVA